MASPLGRFPRAVPPAGNRDFASLPAWAAQVRPAKTPLLFYAGHDDGSWSSRAARSALVQALATRFRVVVAGEGIGPSDLPAPARSVRIPTFGTPEADRERRRLLVNTCASLQPGIVLLEQYPFGDLHLSAEIAHLLHAAAANVRTPLVASSVTRLPGADPSTRAEVGAARSAIEGCLDAILVHADPQIARLPDDGVDGEARWSVPIRYTGFIGVDPRGPADVPAATAAQGNTIVVLGAGGGAGDQLCHLAVQASRYLAGVDPMPMRVVADPGMPDFEFNALKEAAAGIAGVLVEREAANLTEVLAEAAVTVSYSSCPLLDAVRTRVPALVVPCASGSDVSASRARRLAALGAIRLVEPEWLDAPTLAAQIAATVGFAPQAVDLDLSGAHATVRFLAALSEAANRFSARPVEDGARFAAIDNRSTTRLRT